MITGRLRDRAKASTACWETVSVRIALPIDMKKLGGGNVRADSGGGKRQREVTAHPKVAPDPSINCPRVLITPFGPAPYLIMFTDPVILLS
jgi:hypothetical protein